jgi:hypothetical protein
MPEMPASHEMLDARSLEHRVSRPIRNSARTLGDPREQPAATLPTDLIDHLYRQFDECAVRNSLVEQVDLWLIELGVARGPMKSLSFT